jgi:hypothetical protein
MNESMNCQLSPIDANERGVLYGCETCLKRVRSRQSPDRINMHCRGTSEQWRERVRANVTVCIAEDVLPAALEQVDRCLACPQFRGYSCPLVPGKCREDSWLKWIQRGPCELAEAIIEKGK